jgi:hypothetical protein
LEETFNSRTASTFRRPSSSNIHIAVSRPKVTPQGGKDEKEIMIRKQGSGTEWGGVINSSSILKLAAAQSRTSAGLLLRTTAVLVLPGGRWLYKVAANFMMDMHAGRPRGVSSTHVLPQREAAKCQSSMVQLEIRGRGRNQKPQPGRP